MAKDVGDGYLLVTERTFLRFEPAQLEQLAFEIERSQRDIRGEQVALDDLPAIQQRNRKLQRLTQALAMLRGVLMRRRSRLARSKS